MNPESASRVPKSARSSSLDVDSGSGHLQLHSPFCIFQFSFLIFQFSFNFFNFLPLVRYFEPLRGLGLIRPPHEPVITRLDPHKSVAGWVRGVVIDIRTFQRLIIQVPCLNDHADVQIFLTWLIGSFDLVERLQDGAMSSARNFHSSPSTRSSPAVMAG